MQLYRMIGYRAKHDRSLPLPQKIVILSEGTHSTIVSAAVEGPAGVFALAVVCPLPPHP